MGLRKLTNNTGAQHRYGPWRLPLAAALVAGLLMLGGDTAREWFQFDRSGIFAAELWRLVTGHFVHLGWPHLALNVAGLGLVWFLVGDVFDRRNWLLIGATSLLIIDLGLWFFNPQLMWYVGLSGLLHGLLAAGLVGRLRDPDRESVALAVLLLAKLAWEQASGPLPGSETTAGGAVIVNAHLFGALGGIVGALIVRIRVRRQAAI